MSPGVTFALYEEVNVGSVIFDNAANDVDEASYWRVRTFLRVLHHDAVHLQVRA